MQNNSCRMHQLAKEIKVMMLLTTDDDVSFDVDWSKHSVSTFESFLLGHAEKLCECGTSVRKKCVCLHVHLSFEDAAAACGIIGSISDLTRPASRWRTDELISATI